MSSDAQKTMPASEIEVKSLDDLIAASSASSSFKQAIRFMTEGKTQEKIQFGRHCPPIKVLRLVTKLLEVFPCVPFDAVRVEAESGCSEFVGTAAAEPGGMRFEFDWDCRWRAEEQGWLDPFGEPDQGRAARVFGYQCFRKLERI